MGKNNHYVPRRYLKRFRSTSEREVALYNLKTARIVEKASIGDQCSRNWFYTKNPIFETTFTGLEAKFEGIFERMIADEFAPAPTSDDRQLLSAAIMFQEGRTVATAEQSVHLASEFIKFAMRHDLERKGEIDALAALPGVKIKMPDVIMDAILHHLIMPPLIGDLDCTLFANRTDEDFLTCDHPIALGNNLPPGAPSAATSGFSSRGLMIALPLSPRALVLLSDREVYKVTRNDRGVAYLTDYSEVVGLNLAQCFIARENLYFSSPSLVGRTLGEFERNKETLRMKPPKIVETPMQIEGRIGVQFGMARTTQRFSLPKIVCIRPAAKSGRYALGDAFVRDPLRRAAVGAKLDRVNKLRQVATDRAKASAENEARDGGESEIEDPGFLA
jgi:hypothetical protein